MRGWRGKVTRARSARATQHPDDAKTSNEVNDMKKRPAANHPHRLTRNGSYQTLKTDMQNFLKAISLLTRLPVRVTWDDTTPPGRMMAWYPVVGLVLGLLLALPVAAFGYGLPAPAVPLLGPAIVLAIWVGLTGALHLDGWADFCDAMFVHASREKRLQIMADPRLGSFGATGLVVLLLLKLAALQGIMQMLAQRPTLFPLLIGAPVLARTAIVWVCWTFPLAKPDGMAAHFKQGLARRDLILALATAALVAACAGWRGLVCIGLAVLTAGLLGRLAVRKIGGITGDVLGATVEAVETVVLVACCLANESAFVSANCSMIMV